MNLKADKFSSDFENAMRSAASETWPNVRLVGCYFHYTQALSRKARSFPEVSRSLKTSSGMKILKMYLRLPLLPEDMVSQGVKIIVAEERRLNLTVTFDSFHQYFNRYWMKKIEPKGFCVSLEKHRTNNYLESFNARISKHFSHKPTIYKWIGKDFSNLSKVD